MQDYYVACYFWHGTENPLRKKLKDEFCARYPWVIILEPSAAERKPGFIDYKLINKFLAKHIFTIRSLTIMDTDIIVQDNFRDLISKKFELCSKIDQKYDKIQVTHNFNKAYEVVNDVKYPFPGISKHTEGHTGFSWTFGYQFLRRIGYKFPEKFLLGGFDYILAKIYIHNKDEEYFINLLGPEALLKL